MVYPSYEHAIAVNVNPGVIRLGHFLAVYTTELYAIFIKAVSAVWSGVFNAPLYLFSADHGVVYVVLHGQPMPVGFPRKYTLAVVTVLSNGLTSFVKLYRSVSFVFIVKIGNKI